MMPSVTSAFVAAWLFWPLVSGASAQWSISSRSATQSLAPGVTQVRKTISGATTAEIILIVFDAAKVRLQVVDQPSAGAAVTLAEGMRAIGALAGCNGGYFTPEFQPLGLQISQGRRTGAFQRSSLLGGVLMVRKGRPVMLWRDEFVEQQGITDLLQAGPRLVNGGMPVKGLETTKSRPRTFVLTDTAGRWAMGACGSVTLRQLSDILASPAVITELHVERALNLDGGRSTGLWWRDASGQEQGRPEYARVRNFLAILPVTSR